MGVLNDSGEIERRNDAAVAEGPVRAAQARLCHPDHPTQGHLEEGADQSSDR